MRYLFSRADFSGRITVLDKETYAARPWELEDCQSQFGASGRWHYVRGDIADQTLVRRLFQEEAFDTVVHLAAESHVDRSIAGPAPFITTNVVGTFTLLEAAREAWAGRSGVRFHLVSTDEVFGQLGLEGHFTEVSPYAPRSPYSASKAAADHLARAWYHTYGLPVTLSNGSNNYGPGQHPEKLIPRMLQALREGQPLPVYGDGLHSRDWLHVHDHAAGLWRALSQGQPGETYLFGGGNEVTNLALVHQLCELAAPVLKVSSQALKNRISFVPDRPGHDRRYAVDTSRTRKALGWAPQIPFETGLKQLVESEL